MTWTTAKTATAKAKITQKFWPVSAALSGYQGEGMQIRYQVEYADEDAQSDGHGEVDNREANTEEDAHDKGHHALSADIIAQLALCILGQLAPERSALLWEYLDPVLSEVFIVHQDEEHI